MADAVADHAEHRRDQRADIIERGEHRQQQHRSGLDQHVPAEDQRLHLERPRCEQIGRPLEAVVPDLEGCQCGQRGRPRNPAQDALTRFMRSTLPCFLLVPDLQLRRGAGQPRRFGQSTGSAPAAARFGKIGKSGVNRRWRAARPAKTPDFQGKLPRSATRDTAACGRTREQNVTDLTDRNRLRLNRLSKDGLHSDRRPLMNARFS